MNQIVQQYEQPRLKKAVFDFRPGDTVRVSVRIVEGEKERIQDFEGICVRRHGYGVNESFTVRRISYGVGMERIFPLHAPRIEDVRVVRRGKVRRANLSYLRNVRGKKARVTEDILRTRKMAAAQADGTQAIATAAAEAAPAAAAEEAKSE